MANDPLMKLNPIGWCSDMAGANLAGITRVHGNASLTFLELFEPLIQSDPISDFQSRSLKTQFFFCPRKESHTGTIDLIHLIGGPS